MNFSKSLFKKYNMCCYVNSALFFSRNLNCLSLRSALPTTSQIKQQKFTKRKSFIEVKKFYSYNSSNFTEIEEVTGVYPYGDNQPLSQAEVAMTVLFENNNDPKISEIEKCASVEEVFTFVRDNINKLEYKHLSQIVLTLYELQSIYIFHYEEEDNFEIRRKFYKKLLEHKEFYMVTTALENALKSFDPLFLSYTILYLNRLGVPEESHLIQNMAVRLKDQLLDNFSLDIVTRLIRVIFLENSVRPFYIIIDLIPKICNQIDLINTTKDLEDLSICLYKLNNILTEDILNSYKSKVNQLIKDHILTEADHQLILKIMAVFNYPKWRNQYCSMISKCTLLMKNSIESSNLAEMYLLYDIFFKNQEPGDALNEIQRGAAKLLHEIDDTESNQRHKLKLFSSIIYFSSPINKEQFRQNIEKYLSEKETLPTFLTLRRVYSYLKISDPKLCDVYWNKACQILKEEKDFDKIMKLMENFVYFSTDLQGFRHHAFEHHILTIIQKHLDAGTLTLFPHRLFGAFAFALLSCYNVKLFNSLHQAFCELGNQMTPLDIFKISQSLLIIRQKNSPVTPLQLKEIKETLHKATAKLKSYYTNLEPSTCGLLIKSAIVRSDYENELIDEMLTSLKTAPYMSSKIMEYMCFNLYATKTLIPEVVNMCTEYIVRNKKNIVGFNAEKIVYLLFQLNYQPVYEDEFFETVVDIIIRDQERLSGLGFLQASLALCYFNRMPRSFIKQIFNVEFLDKLDVELANCYFRDRYPQRVRDILMQLNRAVCLEYPEYNVPWFHQKYIEEYHKTNAIDDLVHYFHRSVKEYLTSILEKDAIQENVVASYGYDINFVLHLDKNKNPTTRFDDPHTTKVAVLLKNDRAFTRFCVHLRGRHALKQRHLEMLGYKVKMITKNEWINLLYAKEKVDFIKEVVFS